jgi:hypothetical protein
MSRPEDIVFHDSILDSLDREFQERRWPGAADEYLSDDVEELMDCEECGETHVVDTCPLDAQASWLWSGAFDGDEEADLSDNDD